MVSFSLPSNVTSPLRHSGGATEPHGKLGKLPKNQRLKDAMAQHNNAKPKPKGWLMAVVEQIYKDGQYLCEAALSIYLDS